MSRHLARRESEIENWVLKIKPTKLGIESMNFSKIFKYIDEKISIKDIVIVGKENATNSKLSRSSHVFQIFCRAKFSRLLSKLIFQISI